MYKTSRYQRTILQRKHDYYFLLAAQSTAIEHNIDLTRDINRVHKQLNTVTGSYCDYQTGRINSAVSGIVA